MRAWAYRDLGPGVFTNDYGPEYDKMGDVKLEGNLEFRFPFYSYLKGAAFVDVGNVWLLHESETFPVVILHGIPFISNLLWMGALASV